MQVNKTSGTNFTGVIPVRVFQNGKEVLEKNLVRKTCLEVINGLAGPIKDKPQFKQTAAMLSVMDHDYKFARAFHGYSRVIADKKLTPSDFFKIIFDRFGRGYIVTGKQSDKISELGHQIGIAKRECNIYNTATSPKLEAAKKNYWNYIEQIGNNLDLRIKEAFSPATLEKFGKYQQMNVQINTKTTKSKSLPKIILEKINFSARNPG